MKTKKQLEKEIEEDEKIIRTMTPMSINADLKKLNLRVIDNELNKATLTQTNEIIKLIEGIEIIKESVGKGCNNKKEMELFRFGYENGRKVFISELLRKIKGDGE